MSVIVSRLTYTRYSSTRFVCCGFRFCITSVVNNLPNCILWYFLSRRPYLRLFDTNHPRIIVLRDMYDTAHAYQRDRVCCDAPVMSLEWKQRFAANDALRVYNMTSFCIIWRNNKYDTRTGKKVGRITNKLRILRSELIILGTGEMVAYDCCGALRVYLITVRRHTRVRCTVQYGRRTPVSGASTTTIYCG